jgi:hypothetical protein
MLRPSLSQAITLKFRLLSIYFTSEAFDTGRKMSVIEISQHLWVFAVIQLSFWFARRLDSHFEPSAKSTSSMVIVCFLMPSQKSA